MSKVAIKNNKIMPYNSDIPKNIEEDQLSSFTHLEYIVQKNRSIKHPC